MGFNFSITDITTNFGSSSVFQRDDDRTMNSLNTYGKKDDELLTYPLDLGSIDRAHYMVFQIFEQEVSNFKGTRGSNSSLGRSNIDLSQGQVDFGTLQSQGVVAGSGQVLTDLTAVGGEMAREILKTDLGPKLENIDISKQSVIAAGVAKLADSGITPLINEIKNTNVTNFNRKIKRIKETVALYLPDTLTFDYRQGYSDVGMYEGKKGLGAVAASAVSQMTGALNSQNSAEIISEIAGKNLSPFISRILGEKGGGAGKVLASTLLGGVENPMLELLYTAPEFRTFQFDFMFYPRSVAESTQVYKIINCLKFHSAPEIKPGSAGFFLVPPSVFNIEFYYNGKVNPNLPVLSDCVCTSVSVDYAPSGSGWSAYEVPAVDYAPQIGGTGSPFSIRLSLSFKETIILTKGLHQKTASGPRDNR